MRYYLDTNILIFYWQDYFDGLSHDTMELLSDYGNILLTSTVCVHELIYLCSIGKVSDKRRRRIAPEGVIDWMHTVGIEIVHVTERHLQQLAALPIYDEHHDPNDRLIVAQAIADKIPVVSSDRKFRLYESAGLDFIYNRR